MVADAGAVATGFCVGRGAIVSTNYLKLILLAGAAVVAAPAGIAHAQDASEEVVVTAQRREQALQDVPITLQVVTAEAIDQVAADDMGDMSAFVPGLSVSNSSPTQARYSIRGVTTSDFGVGTDPAVGVYVDGVYAARSGAGLLAFSDVARIEVLKGPQGTLFGRNSAAGAVSITTNQPSDEFEARLGVRFGEYDKRRFEGLINLPIADTLALRVNTVVNQRDGWLTDGATGQDYDREENWAVRGALRWDVTPNTQATLSYTHDNVDQDARPAIGIVDVSGPGAPPVPANPNAYTNPFRSTIYNDVIDNHETRELDEVTLNITHEFGDITFTSLTSARHFETENREDEDGTNRVDLYFDTNNREDNDSFYQEFRFAGGNEALDWIAGISYYDETAHQRSDTFANTSSINTTLANAIGATPFQDLEDALGGFATVMELGWSEDMINRGDFTAAAAFADVIWHATDRLNLTFGLRYTRDEKTFQWLNTPRAAPELDATLAALVGLNAIDQATADAFQFDVIFDMGTFAGVACDNGVTVAEGVTCELSDEWENVSPRFVLDYNLTDDVMLFASYARGYKAGGFNSVQPGSRFDNEDVDNYEIGIKSEFDNGLILNVSAFSYLYEGKQSITLVPVGSVQQYVTTTSDDEAWGVDAQLNWSPTEALSLFVNAQYIDSTFKNKVTSGGDDLSGQPTGEPYWSWAGGVSYQFDFASAGTLDLSLVHAYRGEGRCNDDSIAQGNCSPNPVFDPSEAQNRTDFRAYWRDQSERVQLGFFVNNLFDEQYVTGINNITAASLGTPFVGLTEPRMWGVDLSYTY